MPVPDASNFTQRVNALAMQRGVNRGEKKPNSTFAAQQYSARRAPYFNNRNPTPSTPPNLAILEDMTKITTVNQLRTLEALFVNSAPSQLGTTLTLNGKLPASAFVGGTVMQDITVTRFKMAYIAPNALIDVSKIFPLGEGDALIFPINQNVSVVLWDGGDENTKTTLSTDGTNTYVQSLSEDSAYPEKTPIAVGEFYMIGGYQIYVYAVGSTVVTNLTAKEQRLRGVTIQELKTIYGGMYSDSDILNAGYNLFEIQDGGYSIVDAHTIYPDKKLFEYLGAGYSRDDVLSHVDLFDVFYLKHSGFTATELRDAGIMLPQFVEAYNTRQYISYTNSQLTQAGFTDTEIQEFRTSFQIHQFSLYTIPELKEAGFTDTEIQQAGYPLRTLRIEGGYTALELRYVTEFTILEYVEAGYTPYELREAGYRILELFNAGLSLADIYSATYSEDVIQTLLFQGYTITAISERARGSIYQGVIPTEQYYVTRDHLTYVGIDLTNPKADTATSLQKPTARELSQYVLPNFTIPQLLSVGYSLLELRDTRFMKQDYDAQNITIVQLKDAGWTIADLGGGSPQISNIPYYTGSAMKEAGYTLKEFLSSNSYSSSIARLRTLGFTATEMKNEEISAIQLRTGGYTASEVRAAGYSFSDAKAAAYSASQLKAGGYSDTDILAGGFMFADLKAAGYTASQLRVAGYSFSDAKAAGYTALELKNGGYSDADILTPLFSVPELRAAGYTALQVKSAGYNVYVLANGGYGLVDLKNAAYSAVVIRSLGIFSDADILAAGFTSTDLKAAGYTALQLKSAGYSVANLIAAGYDQSVIVEVGYPISELYAQGYANSAAQLKLFGYLVADLLSIGYTVAQLKNAGFTAVDFAAANVGILAMSLAGFTAFQLKGSSYADLRAITLVNAGYTMAQLYAAGIGHTISTIPGIPTVQQFFAAGWDIDLVTSAGYSPYALKIGGYSASDILNEGFRPNDMNPPFDLVDLRLAEITVQQFYESGRYTLTDVYNAGYAINRVVGTGYLMTSGYKLVKATYIDRWVGIQYTVVNMVNLANAGYSPEQIVTLPTNVVLFIPYMTPEEVGITMYVTPKGIGCPVKVLYFLYKQLNSFTPERMRTRLMYTASELRSGGYTAADLRSGGYTVEEIYKGGYNAAEMRAAGYTTSEIGSWYNVDQRYLAGYSWSEIRLTPEYIPGIYNSYFGIQLSIVQMVAAGYDEGEVKYQYNWQPIDVSSMPPPVLTRYGE